MNTVADERAATRRWWTWIIVITLAGLAVRVAYILLFRHSVIHGTLPSGQPLSTRVWGDGYVYHEQANLLVDGKGLIAPLPYYIDHVRQQAADHPPLYVLYLAIYSALGLRGDLTHMLVSAPLGAMSALTFGLLGRRIWSPRAGIVAAVIGAFNPSIIHFPGFVLSETLTIPLMAALGLWLYRFWDAPTWRNAAGTGVWCGLAVLSHPDSALMVVFAIVPAVFLVKALQLRARLVALVAAGITCGALVLPWVGFNLARYEKPVYLSVGADYSMAQGSCDETYYGELIGFFWLRCMGERLEGTDLALKDQSLGAEHLRHETFAYIRDHLRRTPIVVAARIGRVLGVFRPIQQANLESFIEGRERWLTNLAVVSWYPLALASIAGAFLVRRRGRPIFPLVAMVVSVLIGTALTLAVLRYRAGAEPAIAALAAVTIDAGITWVQRAWRDRDPVTVEVGTAA
jgi:4-amino-4-deoxy-L-arabinose transferase-like glycosyltransferase